MESISTPTDIDRRYPKRAFLHYENVIVNGKGQPVRENPELEHNPADLDTELTFGEWKDAQ